ncbi:MAG TPA: vitamin K epoxide reductase family protein [Solirubrobacteraceae bacterium]|nr:vitamin K epoxide reductase family protein [Solirubrobacteraceae bacterium]
MSNRALKLTMVVFAALGLGVASYLTYVHYSGGVPICSISHGCEKVQKSEFAELAGVPVALIGLLGYIFILGSLLVPVSETTRLATMTFTVVGFGFSAYLTYRELFSIHAICQWCVSSAVIMTLLVVLAVWRFLRGDGPVDSALTQVDPEADSPPALGAAHV